MENQFEYQTKAEFLIPANTNPHLITNYTCTRRILRDFSFYLDIMVDMLFFYQLHKLVSKVKGREKSKTKQISSNLAAMK